VISPTPGADGGGGGALDAETGGLVRERLAGGGTVVVLAQDEGAVGCYPVPVEMAEVATAWGSTVFHFTCDQRALPALPERAMLAGEDATVVPTHLLTRVGAGRLVTCQYRLAGPAGRDDPAAKAILGDLLAWAARGAR
jgi:hypothetical protein